VFLIKQADFRQSKIVTFFGYAKILPNQKIVIISAKCHNQAGLAWLLQH
jgi:hypothetical protein